MVKTAFSWNHPTLFVKRASSEGQGVFTKSDIPKGTIVMRFGGHVMTLAQEATMPPPLNDYPHQIDDSFVFGVSRKEDIELGDHFNHSCKPNVGWKGQIFLMTMRKIRAGEELTFDYAMVLGGNIKYDIECLCSLKTCRKRIRAHDWKSPILQKKYDGYFQWYIQEKIDKLNRRRNAKK